MTKIQAKTGNGEKTKEILEVKEKTKAEEGPSSTHQLDDGRKEGLFHPFKQREGY